jgi:TolB-like protein/DNA-binding winged helix-turn-helix (wHTH) protein/Tfp pilus assembly protein PilF
VADDPAPTSFRFGLFEVDLTARELTRQGRRIPLQEKPFQTLVFLLSHAGEVVTRDDLRHHLWPADTFVQFDDNLNTAIKRVREALGDAADNPRFVETVPRRGYRFLVPVESSGPPATVIPKQQPDGRLPQRREPLLSLGISLGATVLLFVLARPWSAHAPAAPAHSRSVLAVLPFRNLSGDPAQDYVSDGFSEELIAHLGRLNPSRLGVIARSSVIRYKTAPADARMVGRDLDAGYVLEGSVRRAGGRIGITAQLVEVQSQTHVWSETWERPAADLLVVERDVARGVAEALAIRLLPAQEASLARASTTSTEAYDAWLNGLSEWNRGTRDSFEEAARSFERAAEIDPSFALAHDGAARSYLSLAGYRFRPEAEAYGKARVHVEAALRVDENIPQSWELRAEILDKVEPANPAVEDSYRRATELNPSDAYAQRTYALHLLGKHRTAEAAAHIAAAVELDPKTPSTLCYGAYVFLRANNYGRAQALVTRALTLDADFPFAHYVQGHLDNAAGRTNDAIVAFQKAVASSGRTPKYLYSLAEAYVKAGRKDQAERILVELREQSDKAFVPPEFIRQLADQLKPYGAK